MWIRVVKINGCTVNGSQGESGCIEVTLTCNAKKYYSFR